MKVKTIIDNKNGKKWEIYKHTDNTYSFIYSEYFKNCGWQEISDDINYTKEAIEFMFDIKLEEV